MSSEVSNSQECSQHQVGGSARGYHRAVVSLAALRAGFPSTRREEWPQQRKLFQWLPAGLPALSFKIGTWL